MTAFTDPEGRATLADYVDVPNVYAAGRLDYDSEGLMILTSDGRLAHHITHPKHKLHKVYWVQVDHVPTADAVAQLQRGVVIKGQPAHAVAAKRFTPPPELFARSEPIRTRKTIPTAWLQITLAEGRKRQVRRMTAAVGHPTLRLIRAAIGPIRLGGLQPGEWRDLTPHELNLLKQAGPKRNSNKAKK